MSERIRSRRSLPFVPAVRPDRFPKALAAGPDAVCLDLEGAVGRLVELPVVRRLRRVLALAAAAGAR